MNHANLPFGVAFDLRQTRAALERFGCHWCANCGTPHFHRDHKGVTRDERDESVVLKRYDDEGNVTFDVLCILPENLRCLTRHYERYGKRGADMDGQASDSDEFDAALCTWALESGAWRKGHLFWGAWQALLEDWICDPVHHLLLARAKLQGPRIGETTADFLRIMGMIEIMGPDLDIDKEVARVNAVVAQRRKQADDRFTRRFA